MNTRILAIAALLAVTLSLSMRPQPSSAATGEGASQQASSVAESYLFDAQTGPFLASVSAVSTTSALSSAAAVQSNNRRTFYPCGRSTNGTPQGGARQTLPLHMRAADAAATCTVRLYYWGRHPTTGARVDKGFADFDLAVDSTAQQSTTEYSAPIRYADSVGASEIDVVITALSHGPISAVGVGSY